jgi:hypothetical protein
MSKDKKPYKGNARLRNKGGKPDVKLYQDGVFIKGNYKFKQ